MASTPSARSTAGQTQARRAELAEFLRTRRERLTPDEVGLPGGGRRRTPGLRREEVATLAGVGIAWYTWLEQGRRINASAQVLEAIARALRMDPHERQHLARLADSSATRVCTERPRLSTGTIAILDRLDPFPAVVLSRRHDILGYNRAFNAIAGDLDAIDPADHNQIWLAFTHRHWRHHLFQDRDEALRHLVGSLRAAMADHLNDPLWTDFVDQLLGTSAEFTELWNRHEVIDQIPPVRDLASPVGDLHLTATSLTSSEGDATRLVVYSPRTEQTRARLDQLVHPSESGGSGSAWTPA